MMIIVLMIVMLVKMIKIHEYKFALNNIYNTVNVFAFEQDVEILYSINKRSVTIDTMNIYRPKYTKVDW